MTRLLPWLDAATGDGIVESLRKAAEAEIEKRHWGTLAKRNSKGSTIRLYILDIRGLLLVAGLLRYHLGKCGTGVLYRGQPQDWRPCPALFRGAQGKAEVKSRLQWLSEALEEIEDAFDPSGKSDEREALAQHYGLPTRWLDAADNIQTAAWFAYYRNRAAPRNRDAAVGYIYALAYPLANPDYATALDLRLKPSQWLRPHIQQAWCIRQGKAGSALGLMEQLHLITFIVPRPLLAEWCSFSCLAPGVMFPNSNEDSGLQFWKKAESKLTSKKLLPVPWLQKRRIIRLGWRPPTASP